MKHILFVMLVVLCSCSSTVKTTDNNLSKTDESNGWKMLFDGASMNGWRTYQNKPADSWSVKDGTLYCAGSKTDKSDRRSDLITAAQFENFDLELDWKLAPQGNSGVMYMVSEEFPAAYQSGPEYQLIDDNNFPDKLEDWQKTGANYAMDAAPTAASKAIGEWNHTRIVVNKGHVEHWLNGVKVVDYQLWTDEWNKKKAEGKWKDTPGYGMSRKGHIALQDHGSEAWFKNIKIKEL